MNNLPAIFTFIDYKKALELIHRAKMTRIQRAMILQPTSSVQLKQCTPTPVARVTVPDRETEHIDLTAGLLQEDTPSLSTFSFIIVLNYVIC